MRICAGMLWKFIKRKSRVAMGLSDRERYQSLRIAYETNPTELNANALQQLIGTSSPAEDVLFAMKTEFDSAFYLAVNADVRASGIDPSFHYLLWGWKEHRTPSRFFDPQFYLQRNKDLGRQEMALAHYAVNGRKNNIPANAIGDKLWFTPCCPTDEEWNNVAPAMRSSKTKAVVILPVYKGLEETLSAIYAALRSRNADEYSLLVVNDKSPDQVLAEKLGDLAKKGLFDYHDSNINRGFVKTINYAIEHLSGDLDVILLNSDAYVSPGWFNRLIAHAERDATVATITPLSNNATICSYPLYDRDNYHELELSHERLDHLAAVANKGLSVETPTGVGFCFYMRRTAINAIGALDDAAFLVGYGEENDFCMRALNAGLKNLIVGDVFVFHTGSVSFSSIKEENFARGQYNLGLKHANYDLLVRSHVNADPERFMRRNLDAARLVAEFAGAVIVVTHKWSGGIETYLSYYRSKLAKAGKKCIFFRVHDLHHVTIEDPASKALFLPNLVGLDLRTQWGFVTDLISRLSPSLIHVNSFAGLNWLWHRRFVEHFTGLETELAFIGHDYSPISHHYQLLRPDNIFDGIPDLNKLQVWENMTDWTGSADVCSPQERAAVYESFFKGNVKVEVPSNAARQIYERFYPNIDIEVVPHEDHLPDVAHSRRSNDGERLLVAIVGAIGPHKGSDVLASLARDARARGLPIDYYLIGYSNDDTALENCGVRVSGRYDTEIEALEALDKIKPDLFFIPSIWPETFCYTLSMAFKKRIPPVVFDIGAQSERVSELAWGAVLPIGLSLYPSKLSDTLLSLDISDLWSKASGR